MIYGWSSFMLLIRMARRTRAERNPVGVQAKRRINRS